MTIIYDNYPITTQEQPEVNIYENSSNGEGCYKFTAAKKQIVNMPDMSVENGENCYVNEQNESTYDGASGKFVAVDQMRLKNINKISPKNNYQLAIKPASHVTTQINANKLYTT